MNPKECPGPENCTELAVCCRSIEQERELRDLQVSELKNAILVARQVLEQRLEGMNELRDQISRERGQYLSRELFDKLFGVVEVRVRELESFRSNIDGRIYMIGAGFAALQVVIAVLMFMIQK